FLLPYVDDYIDHLISFPTRRSSDLYNNSNKSSLVKKLKSKFKEVAISNRNTRGIDNLMGLFYFIALLIYFFKEISLVKLSNYTRSEEHTSELQSRFDLVCRLLL